MFARLRAFRRRFGWVPRGRSASALLLLFGAFACASEPPAPQPVFASVTKSAPLSFQYQLIDGRSWLASESLRGRPAVLGFLTSYDLASQAQARFLNGIARRLGGRVQVGAIMLERIENRPLIIAFRDGLDLSYPVAMGDPDLIAGRGPFGDVQAVPATVVLDAEARLVWKKLGLTAEEEIEKVLQGL
jgi:hypothetical protein